MERNTLLVSMFNNGMYLCFPFFLRFEIAIFVLIFLNMVSMGIEHYNQSRVVTFTLEISNALFTTIFSLGKMNKISRKQCKSSHRLQTIYFMVNKNLIVFVVFKPNVKSFGLFLPYNPPGVARHSSITPGAPIGAPKQQKIPSR